MNRVKEFLADCPRAMLIALAVLFLAGIILRFGPMMRPLAVLDGITTVDDTYLSLEIAKNIGQGLGPLHGRAHTNGFQPLYVFLAAPVYAALPPGPHSVETLDLAAKLAIGVVLLFDLASAALLLIILHRLFGWSWATVAGAGLWLLHPALIRLAMNGLETGLAHFFILVAWHRLLILMDDRGRVAPALLLGVALGLGCMARIDQFFLGLAVAVVLAIDSHRKCVTVAEAGRDYLLIFAGFFPVYMIWVIYSYLYTGLVYPVSGEAVRYMALEGKGGISNARYYQLLTQIAMTNIWRNSPVLIGAIAILSIPAIFFRRQQPEWLPLFLPILFAALLIPVYIFHIQASWFFGRYLSPVIIALLVKVVYILRTLESEFEARGWQQWFPLLTSIPLFAVLFQSGAFRTFTSENDPNRGYRNIGIAARGVFPPGTVVGAPQTGALAYYRGEYEVINLDGVVNEAAFQAHLDHDVIGYIQREGIDYVIAWEINFQFIRNHTEDFNPAHMVYRMTLPEHRSWNYEWHVYEIRGDENAP